MGGNAFRNVGRVQREDIPATLDHVIQTLQFPNFTPEYVAWALMGSTGKKASSGDIDIAMNTYRARFVGEPERVVFNKYELLARLEQVLPKERINTTTFRMGNLMTAWPIAGDPNKGLVQVDFVFGKADWLLFTHYSPAEGESRFKGVFLQQGLGIWAKMHKDFEQVDPTRTEQDLVSPLRVARVGLHLSLELGLFRSWKAEVVREQGPRQVEPGYLETKFPLADRYPRIGWIDDPQSVLDILLGPGFTPEHVNTFEKFVAWINTYRPDQAETFKERFLNNLSRHNGMLGEVTLEEMAADPVWDLHK